MKNEDNKFTGRPRGGDKPNKHGSRDDMSKRDAGKNKSAPKQDDWEKNKAIPKLDAWEKPVEWTTSDKDQDLWDSPTPWEPESAAKAEERANKIDKREDERPSKRKKGEEERRRRGDDGPRGDPRGDPRTRRGDGRRPGGGSNREYVRGGSGRGGSRGSSYTRGAGGRGGAGAGRGWEPQRNSTKDFEWGTYQQEATSPPSRQQGGKKYNNQQSYEEQGMFDSLTSQSENAPRKPLCTSA